MIRLCTAETPVGDSSQEFAKLWNYTRGRPAAPAWTQARSCGQPPGVAADRTPAMVGAAMLPARREPRAQATTAGPIRKYALMFQSQRMVVSPCSIAPPHLGQGSPAIQRAIGWLDERGQRNGIGRTHGSCPSTFDDGASYSRRHFRQTTVVLMTIMPGSTPPATSAAYSQDVHWNW